MTGCTGKAKEVKLHEEYEHDSEPKASTGVIEPEPMFFYAPNGKPQSDAAETIEIMPFFIPEDIASDGRCASCEEMEEKNGMLSAYHTGRANVNEERVPQNVRAAIINYAIATGVDKDAVYEDNFKYALYVDSDGDMHHRNAGYIEELYEIPYNLYDYDPQTDGGTKAPESISSDAYGFMTNREMTEQYGGIFAMSCVDDAKEYIKAVYSYDYTDPFVMQMHAENCSYAPDWSKNRANTAWGLLFYGEAQCSGYARGMLALFDAVGIESRYVHAAKAAPVNPSHQWNLVKLDGKWYHLDVQMMDSSYSGTNKPILLMGNHLNFDESKYPKIAGEDIVLQ